jgi:formiminoglutamate deiminase
MTRYWCDSAILPDGPATHVLLEETSGRWSRITPDADPGDAHRLPGVVLPGFANCHSHAFHRALRGRVQSSGSFWSWRRAMYAVADRLDPDRCLDLARATFAEMTLAGITTVGEFSYLHHDHGGTPYAAPNVMAEALSQAAREAGIRLTLLDACYLSGGLDAGGHRPLDGVQCRFGDRDADAWAARFGALATELPDDSTRVGAAIHSVRAVPADRFAVIIDAVGERRLHLHLSEQPAENAACAAHYGRTPAELVDDHGVLGPRTTAVHATHLTDADIALLGRTGTTACLCPTTERDLADGIGPARALADAGSPLSLGTDQRAMIDFFEEMRAAELHQRLATGRRGCFPPEELITMATRHDSLGWPDAGALAVGNRADLVAVETESVRTAGAAADQVIFAAGAADVHTVIIDGRKVVDDHQHRIGDVGRMLIDAVTPLLEER